MSYVTKKETEQFRELGYFVTPPAFDRAILADIAKELDRLHEESIRKADESGDRKGMHLARVRPFIRGAYTNSNLLKELVKAPVYTEACATLLGPDVDLLFDHVVIKPPEKGLPFGWHQDTAYAPCDPLEYLICWTAVGPATRQNGCMWVIPGSHKRGLVEHAYTEYSLDAVVQDETGAVPVEVEPGQVVVMSSMVLHKSGPNVSTEVRRAYVPRYHVKHVVDVVTRQPFGCQFPVIRDGRPAP